MKRWLIIWGLFVGATLGLLALPTRATGPQAPHTMPTFGPDLPLVTLISNTDGVSNLNIAANPHGPLNFVIAATVGQTLTTYATVDGGQTWQHNEFGTIDGAWSDQSIAFGADGMAYLLSPDSRVGVRRSTDGGRTWQMLGYLPLWYYGVGVQEAVASGADVGPASPYLGRLYAAATWTGFSSGGDLWGSVGVTYSTDGGAHWGPAFIATDSSHNQARWPAPAVAGNGTVYLAYQDEDGGPFANLVTRSTNGGVTWSPGVTVTGQLISPTGILAGDHGQYLLGHDLTSTINHDDRPLLAVSPHTPGELYILWTDGRWDSTFTWYNDTGRHADIAFSRSTDGGENWSAPVRVNDDPVADGKDQFSPSLAVGPDGILHAVWLDRREDPNGYAYRLYYSQSTDGGLSWSSNQPVSDGGLVPPDLYGNDIRSALAVNSANSLLLPAWVGSQSGPQIYIDRGTLPPGPTATPSNTPTPATPCPPPLRWHPGPALAPANYAPGGAVADDGNFYVAGGVNPQGAVLPQLARYSPATNSWAILAPLPNPVAGAAVAAIGNRVYVAGGAGNSSGNLLQIYDIATNTWSQGPPIPYTATIELAAGASVNGKLYVIGGQEYPVGHSLTRPSNDWSSPSNDLSSNFIFDPATQTWTQGAPLPETRLLAAATGVGGRVYLFGGFGANGMVATNKLLAYDPTANTWTVLPSPPDIGGYGLGGGISPYGTGQLLVTDGGRLVYTASGDSSLQATVATHIYDITGQTWSPGPPLADPRLWHVQGTLPGGQVIVYGGVGDAMLLPEYSLASTELLPAPGVIYTDVPPGSPFYVYIQCLACRGIISGYSDGTYRPGGNVTRGQVSKIVASTAGLGGTPAGQTFEDVPPTQPFYLWVERLAAAGAISGYGCGGPGEPCVPPANRPYFRPGGGLTRGQLAKIDSQAAGYADPVPPTQQTFADVPPSQPFWLWIERVAARTIISGYACGGPGEPCDPQQRPYFRPGAAVTRGQTAKIVSNTFFPNCQIK